MAENLYPEGVRPGGLTTTKDIRILLCYLLDSVSAPITRRQLEDVLIGEELANYFALAESLSQLVQQGLAKQRGNAYALTDTGRTVAQNLAREVPATVRDAAVRGLVRAQRHATRTASNHSQIVQDEHGRQVQCSIGEEGSPLFQMTLYMPDDLSAEMVQNNFTQQGDTLYALVLAALTNNRELVQKALDRLGKTDD